MTRQQEAILADFKEWSGGHAPHEAEEEVETYIERTFSTEWDEANKDWLRGRAKARRQYVVGHEAWYWGSRPNKANVAEVSIEGGSGAEAWEIVCLWRHIHSSGPPSMKVEVFQDAFAAFEEVPELFAKLATMCNKHPQPKDVILAVLEALDFEDVTDREMSLADMQRARFFRQTTEK
jgi:hypothetical protein